MKDILKNVKRQGGRFFQKLQQCSKRRKLVVGLSSVFVLALFVGGGVTWANHASDMRERQLAERQEKEVQMTKNKQAALEKEQTEQKQQEGQQPGNPTAAQSQAETKKEPKKYATSSDPRSTAYSTTPPAPHPSSFNIRITQSGQLAYGTMMFYNATKGEKGYYGGDLVLSPGSVTVSRSGSDSAPITVSSHSGGTISMPSMPWDDQNPHFFIASPGSSIPSGSSSYNMIVDTFNMPAAGMYQLHIFSGCSDFGSDACESHGFITVHVVD